MRCRLLEIIFAPDAMLVCVGAQSVVVEALEQIGHDLDRPLLTFRRKGAVQLFQQTTKEMLPGNRQGFRCPHMRLSRTA